MVMMGKRERGGLPPLSDEELLRRFDQDALGEEYNYTNFVKKCHPKFTRVDYYRNKMEHYRAKNGSGMTIAEMNNQYHRNMIMMGMGYGLLMNSGDGCNSIVNRLASYVGFSAAMFMFSPEYRNMVREKRATKKYNEEVAKLREKERKYARKEDKYITKAERKEARNRRRLNKTQEKILAANMRGDYDGRYDTKLDAYEQRAERYEAKLRDIENGDTGRYGELHRKYQAKLNKGTFPFTARSAALTQIGFAKRAYEDMRLPGADPAKIEEQYNAAVQQLYERAGEDGISADAIAKSMRTAVGRIGKQDPSIYNIFHETFYQGVRRAEPRIETTRGPNGKVIQERVWDGDFVYPDGTAFEGRDGKPCMFHIRRPAGAKEHSDTMHRRAFDAFHSARTGGDFIDADSPVLQGYYEIGGRHMQGMMDDGIAPDVSQNIIREAYAHSADEYFGRHMTEMGNVKLWLSNLTDKQRSGLRQFWSDAVYYSSRVDTPKVYMYDEFTPEELNELGELFSTMCDIKMGRTQRGNGGRRRQSNRQYDGPQPHGNDGPDVEV